MISNRRLDAILREHRKERQELIAVIRDLNDRLMHLTGRTWTPPPPDEHQLEREQQADERREERRRYTARPEQFPD